MTGDNFPAYVLLLLAISSFLIAILLVNTFARTKIFNSSILFLEYETNKNTKQTKKIKFRLFRILKKP
jgi:hypothetical protein